MDEVLTRARLAGPAALDPKGGLTATVSRSEVEEALNAQDGAELILDVARGDADSQTVRVTWQQQDLEELLRRATGEQVTLTFDREELERALEGPDVEAQGLREKAAILTVALVGAGAAAGGALAMPVGDEGAAGAGPVATAAATNWQSDAAGSGLTGAPSTAGWQTDAASSGQASTAPDTVTWASDASTSGQTGTPSASGWVTDAASTGAPATPGEPVAVPSDGGGIDMPGPATTGALAGGIALLITGAGFVIRGQRRRTHAV